MQPQQEDPEDPDEIPTNKNKILEYLQNQLEQAEVY